MTYQNIAIIAAKDNEKALAKKDQLIAKYNFKDLTKNHKNLANIDLIIALGGDGLMLKLLHDFEKNPIPIYGINYGTNGFLLNEKSNKDLISCLKNTQKTILYPLSMTVIDGNNKKHHHLAINEVSLIRQSSQAIKIEIEINQKKRLEKLVGDGVLVATPAGSTAYNLSAGGPIIPFGSQILSLTTLSPFRPKNWKGALLPENSEIKLKILDHKTRPAIASADSIEIQNAKEIIIKQDRQKAFTILFDANKSLEERIISEQFTF